MKNYVIILIGVIVALVIVGGAVAYVSVQDSSHNNDTIKSCIPNITNATNDNSTIKNTTSTIKNATSTSSSNEPYVVSEVVKFNAQAGEGYYREVTYSDGEFRQFDNVTGELIGSSYDSDQDKLPSMK